jgi:cold shock CspA family protein
LLQKQFIRRNEIAIYFILNPQDEFHFVVQQGNDRMQKIARDEYFPDIIGAVAMYYELTLREDDKKNQQKESPPKSKVPVELKDEFPRRNGMKSGTIQSWNHLNAFGIVKENRTKNTMLFHITGKKDSSWIPGKGDRVQYKISMDKIKKKEIAVDVELG